MWWSDLAMLQLSGVGEDVLKPVMDEARTIVRGVLDTEVSDEARDRRLQEWAETRAASVFPLPATAPNPPAKAAGEDLAAWMIGVLPFMLFGSLVAVPFAGQAGWSLSSLILPLGAWALWLTLFLAGLSSEKNSTRRIGEYWAQYDPHMSTRKLFTNVLHGYASSELSKSLTELARPLATVPVSKVSDYPRQRLPWAPLAEHPSPRASCTDRQAEYLARDWMMYLGASGCIVSQATRDGGADVVSADFVAEVKHYASPVGPDLIRQIFGVAISEGKRPLFFTKTGYKEGARNFAEKNLVALFVYDHAAGTLTARSTEGERALRLGLQAIKGRK